MLESIFSVQNAINILTATHRSSMQPTLLLHNITMERKLYQYKIRRPKANTKSDIK